MNSRLAVRLACVKKRHKCKFVPRLLSMIVGLRLYIMGLATIDPHSHKVQTKFYKIPKFGVNRPISKKDNTAIWKCQNLQRNVWPSGRCPTKRPDNLRSHPTCLIFRRGEGIFSLLSKKNKKTPGRTWVLTIWPENPEISV